MRTMKTMCLGMVLCLMACGESHVDVSSCMDERLSLFAAVGAYKQQLESALEPLNATMEQAETAFRQAPYDQRAQLETAKDAAAAAIALVVRSPL